MTQEAVWIDSIERFRASPHLAAVGSEGRVFLDAFEQGLRDRVRSSAGDRNGVASPFQAAVVALLAGRGIHVDWTVASVPVPGARPHRADVSFRHADVHWVVEIKTGLEFNSLGAALLGARMFKRHEPECRFVVLGLYAKSLGMQPGLLLEAVRGRDLIDDIVVVTVNNIDPFGAWGPWHKRFAEGIEMLVAGLPGGPATGCPGADGSGAAPLPATAERSRASAEGTPALNI